MICWKLWQNWEEDQESTYGNEVWGELFIFSLPLLHISRALKKDHLDMYVVQKVLGWVKKAQHVNLKNNCHCPAASPPQSWSPGSQGLIFADWEARRPLFPSILPTLAGAPSTSNSSAGWLGVHSSGMFPSAWKRNSKEWTVDMESRPFSHRQWLANIPSCIFSVWWSGSGQWRAGWKVLTDGWDTAVKKCFVFSWGSIEENLS